MKGTAKEKGKKDHPLTAGSDDEEDGAGDQLQADEGNGAFLRPHSAAVSDSILSEHCSWSFRGKGFSETEDRDERQGQGDVSDLHRRVRQ